MGKKVKIKNKKKFLSRIILLIILVFIIVLVLGTSSSKSTNTKLIVNNEDMTASLTKSITIDQNGVLYMSLADIKNVFDENIYYEEATRKNNYNI